MNDERENHVRAIADLAHRKGSRQRVDFLDGIAALDPLLRREVELYRAWGKPENAARHEGALSGRAEPRR